MSMDPYSLPDDEKSTDTMETNGCSLCSIIGSGSGTAKVRFYMFISFHLFCHLFCLR